MDKLKQLVATLDEKEIDFIEYVLRYPKARTSPKRLQLFEMILSNQDLTEKEACEKLYGRHPATAFIELRAKLTEAILDQLLYITDKRTFASELTASKFLCRKLLAYDTILGSRNCNRLRSQYFKKGMRVSAAYNYWLEAMLFSRSLMIKQARSRSVKEYEKYSKTLDEFLESFGAFKVLLDSYYRITLPDEFKTNKSEKYEKFTSRILESCESVKLSEDNVNGRYFLLMSRVVYYNFIKAFDRSLKYSLRILKLAKKHKAAGSKSHKAIGNIYAAESYVCLGNYDEAIKHAQLAIHYFREGSANELRTLNIIYTAYLGNKQVNKAEEIALHAIKHPRLVENPFLKAKWLYLQANLLYLKGDMDGALDALYEDRTLMKDTSGWLLGYKLLELMIKIEEGDYYMVGVLLAAFKQHLHRIKKEKTDRAKQIYAVLGQLLKYGGDFKTALTQKSVKEKMQLLKEGKDDLYWNPLGFEVIPFHEWFMHKTQSQKRYTFYR